MGAFFIYIFKSAVCLTLFYLFFRLLLSKETFHRFNRIALLSVLCLSWLIPLIEVTTSQQLEVSQTVLTIEQLLMMAEATITTNTGVVGPNTFSFSWIHIALLVYLGGVLFFTGRNLYSLGCLIKLLFSGKREQIEKGITLIIHEKEVAPFSWMKYIVISRKDLEENGREILIHEMAHVRNRHSIDLLVADICIFFQWFNPGAWLLKQELQNIHEFEADETVIKEGVNAKEYQLLLIKKAVGTRLYSMANSFNHSKLKKRITMMLKEKSSPWARMKYLYVLPLAAVAVTAFARPEVSKTVEEISAVKVNELATIVETTLKENVEVPVDTTQNIKVVGTRGTVRDTVIVEGYVDSVNLVKVKALVLINGKESDSEVLNALDPECIESISVLKDKTGLEIYGEKGKNGVILVQLHPQDKMKQSKFARIENMTARVNALTGVKNVRNLGAGVKLGTTYEIKPGNEPLVYIDGKEALGVNPLSNIPADRIKSFSVLKDKAALETYGDRAKNGVILIRMMTDEDIQYRKEHPQEPYYDALGMAMSRKKEFADAKKWNFFIDGEKVTPDDAAKLSAKNVRSMKFTEDKEKSSLDIHITSEKKSEK